MPRSSSSSPQPEFYYSVARVVQLELQMFFELLSYYGPVLYNILTFCVVMSQRSETLICVTCIVHALMTLRFFFLLRYSFQPAKHKGQLGQKNQTYVFIITFPAATV